MTYPEQGQSPVRKKPRRKLTVVDVIGELLLTVGAFVLLFLGWQLWFTDVIGEQKQETAISAISKDWERPVQTAPPKRADPGEPKVAAAPEARGTVGVLIVPRWGKDWERPIHEGIDTEWTLKNGVGRYPQTEMPGAVGNFAIAAHRMAYGHGFRDLHKLQVGDHIYVETADGWYQYAFRNMQYVLPSGVDVLADVPWDPAAKGVDRVITLTTCNPFFSTAERIAGYGLFETWYPRAEGPPAEIAELVQNR